MNRFLSVLCLAVVLISTPAWADSSSGPFRQTMWNNITDSMHTIGQSPQQAKITKMKLRTARIKTRLHNINRAKRQAWLNGQ